jgi:nitrate/TMAO reductase-like tetraheme cytochrome c subunit
MKKFSLFIVTTLMIYPDLVSGLAAQTSDEHIYVGEKVCRQCHNLPGSRDQYDIWRLSKHARAYASLFKPEAKEIAELSGIDIEPQKSPICLGCHTTAYNVEEWEREETFHFEDGVQCELCHGPGSEYSDPETMRNPEKAAAAGLIYAQKRRCLICHKEKNSHVSVLHSEKFDYDIFLARIKHPGKGKAGQEEMMAAPELSGNQTYAGSYTCAGCHNDPDKGRIFSKWYLSEHAMAYADLSGEKAGKFAVEMKVEGIPQRS